MTHLPLPWRTPPLSLNDRLHWAAENRLKQTIRDTVHLLARSHKIRPVDRATITFHYRPRDNRRRDKDNLMATLKPAIDGLRDAKVLADDDSTRVEPRVVIHPAEPGQPPTTWLTITHYPEPPTGGSSHS